jgi:hypothetical protein
MNALKNAAVRRDGEVLHNFLIFFGFLLSVVSGLILIQIAIKKNGHNMLMTPPPKKF